jgi:hypothetical protein
MPLGRTLTVRQSAEYLGVSTKSVRRYLRQELLRGKLVPGKHGPEIQVFQRSLDSLLGQRSAMSKDKDDLAELTMLWNQANQDVRDVVMKILRSTETPVVENGSGGLLSSLFRKKGG